MPLHVIRNDITKLEVDAIVNAANETLLGGGGVDGQIHKTAGPGLLEECKKLGGCKTGDAKITLAYDLPCKYVIHTVGPIYKDGTHGEADLLKSCYKRCLEIATEHKLESIAFPLISAGAYNYPKKEAFWIAINAATKYLMNSDLEVYIVVFDPETMIISNKLYSDIEEYIDDNYVDNIVSLKSYYSNSPGQNRNIRRRPEQDYQCLPRMAMTVVRSEPVECFGSTLEDELKDIDESFSEMLLRIIDERGLKDSDVYKKANIDRKLFSKIRSNVSYKPSKPTVIAFAIALELNLATTEDMLKKAGFALSHSNKFDVIVEYFIKKGNYNIFEINEALYSFDQMLIGTM